MSISTGSKPVIIGLASSAGAADTWHRLLADLKEDGLASPLLIISDDGQ
jgi:hypothetical protein